MANPPNLPSGEHRAPDSDDPQAAAVPAPRVAAVGIHGASGVAGAADRAAAGGTELDDVTRALNRTNQELANRLEAILTTMSEGVYTVDRAGLVTYANPAALRIFGFSEAEFVGAKFAAHRVRRYDADGHLVDVDEGPSIRAARDGQETQRVTLRYEGLPHGTKWLESSSKVLRDADGKSRGAVISFSDVTEHFLVDEERRLAVQRLDAVFASTLSGVMMVDATGRVVLANEATARIIGVPRAQIVGLSLDDPRLAAFDDTGWPIAVDQRPIAVALREGRVVEGVNISVRRADGTRWITGDASPIRDTDGTVVGAVATLIDVTERKALNEQLQQSQKLEGIGRLAGGIAHDFNNIITAILGGVEFAQDAAAPGSELSSDLNQVREAALRGAALTRQLLTFARRQPVNPRVVHLDSLAKGMEQMLHRVLGEDVQLQVASDPELWAVRADPSQIEQVIMNFVVNARDAMPHGGAITIRTRNERLDAKACERWPGASAGAYVALEVTDTGVGMSNEIISHIFEPFFTTKSVGSGTGLGLSTVYGIVQDAGGFLGVSSEPGRGSAFRVLLPRVAEAPGGREDAAIAPKQGSGVVLVVEDETVVRQLVERALKAYGYTVLTAADGRDALSIIERQASEIDLVLTDVVMPGLSGTDLAARVRELHPGLPVLFMSGYPDHARLMSSEIPAERLLQKPFTPPQLVLRVQRALDGRP